ncbi:hypothetical protein CPB83DRAFT_894534 [Crepidotus variabilis]|uniref:Shugoshin C-terminal domain-containing protein n=1 Tax=Crepidotus variabilis TaxID=179855 RepID=A0A9P6EFU2_9AGAR|nr:hypothetical protein CPB83DRAFT_894534 [Crepidotus variabilis]
MSSRRESRSSLGNRQNDALFEFENFKKKFLLANKHITKLNSTLSIRIEELNAQISMLYVENLRLRASEIALASQLKREREHSRKVLADAEAASQTLSKHLSCLRGSLHRKGEPETPPTPPSPKARRPIANPIEDRNSPPFRIARPPDFPGIFEEEEPTASSTEDIDKQQSPPRKKTKAKPRLSASKLPLPARGPSPTPVNLGTADTQLVNLSIITATSSKPRKGVRRQSGLLTVNTDSLSVPRSGSPAFGSPIRLEAGLAEEHEEMAAVEGNMDIDLTDCLDLGSKKDKRKGKGKEPRESESEKEGTREKKKSKDMTESVDTSIKHKTSRGALQPIDSNVEEISEFDDKTTTQRQFLRAPSPSIQTSSSPAPADVADGSAGRERRVRKSVNYAEPKLNTKMRKPDPATGVEPTRKKRSSAAAVMSSTGYTRATTPSAPQDSDTEPRSSLDSMISTHQGTLPLRSLDGNYIDPENFPLPSSRPGSAAAMYSPGPPTRTTGSTTSESTTSSLTGNAGLPNLAPSVAVRRKKSRPQTPLSDEDSDGATADGEFAVHSNSNFANVDSSRRRGLPKRSAATAAAAALEDIRRHSMVV